MFIRLWSRWTDLFGKKLTRNFALTLLLTLLLAALGVFSTAPPSTLTLAAGPKGSTFMRFAERYQKSLAKFGIKLIIVETAGSADNLARLANDKSSVDVGLVQSGLAKGENYPQLMSLGSVNYQPFFLFYRIHRNEKPKETLAQFAGKRLGIGVEGSGIHKLALELLKANGIEPGGATTLLEVDDEVAQEQLHRGAVDAVFLMGESASLEVLRKLRSDPQIRIMNFAQADGYTRRIKYLNKLILPRGALDLGRDLPPDNLQLLGPTIELIARENLHPALSDALLDAAKEAHGSASFFRKRGEFPAPLEQEFRLSLDAQRYYKEGKSFLYRNLPFWLARLTTSLITVLLPVLLVLLPILRFLPSIYRWGFESRIYRCYGALIRLEREMNGEAMDGPRRHELLLRLMHIENAALALKLPAAFAELFYNLRSHIDFVRLRLQRGEETQSSTIAAP